MALCKICKKRKYCNEICPQLKKEIANRGISPRRKDKTYTVDFSIFESSQNLNPFQLEIKHRLAQDTFLKEISRTDLQNIVQKYLTEREGGVIHFFLEGYRQQEIAEKMGVSQKRVNVLIKKAIQKLRIFFQRRV